MAVDNIDYVYGLESALNSPPSESSERIFLSEPVPLTTKKREALSDFDFAWVYFDKNGKKVRKYPINDRSHAINAMARLNQQKIKNNLTDSKYQKIRSRILKAYNKFGITPKAPSVIKQQKKSKLPMAAEPGCGFSEQCMEKSQMAMTKAQKRENALKNLRKAWKARGIKPTFEPKPKKKATKRPAKKGTKSKPAFVYEPAPKKKVTKSKATKAQLANLAKARAAKAAKATKAGRGASRATSMTPKQAAAYEAKHRKAAAAKKRAATKAKPKSDNRGKYRRDVPVGKYKGQKEGNVIEIKRVYSKSNPDWSKPAVVGAAAGGVLLGVIGSDLLDRFVATMAPQGAEAALTGTDAIKAIRTKSNAWRMGTSALGTVVGIGGAYLMYDKDSEGRQIASVGFAGFGLAFGVKFLTQVAVDVFMPILFKVDSATENSLSNRLYPDKQDYAGLSASDSNGVDASGLMGVGRRPNIFRLPSVKGVGPVATKPVGTAGCGGSGPAHSFLAAAAKRSACASKSCAGDGACSDPMIPSYMQNGAGETKPGGSKVPGGPGVPGPDASNEPFDPGLAARLQKLQPSMPNVTLVEKDQLLQYRLKNARTGVKGVGTQGVYGHLFKKTG